MNTGSQLPPEPPDGNAPLPQELAEQLVAYLDGELEPGETRQLEQRLAQDPQLRRELWLLQKTYEMLDCLPEPEPSPDFATRTLERLPVRPKGNVNTPDPSRPAPFGQTPPLPSTSFPLLVSRPRLRPWNDLLWPAAWLLLVGLAGIAVGYYLAAMLWPPNRTPTAEIGELPITEHRLIELLPLYAAVDNFWMIQQLAGPEYFGEDPLLDFIPQREIEVVDKAESFHKWVQEFKNLPPWRQVAIRELDRELHDRDPAERDFYLHVLETYAVWLSRLPAPQRREILAAPDAAQRLQRIRQRREQQWYDALPAVVRQKLDSLTPLERQKYLQERAATRDGERHAEWTLIRRHGKGLLTQPVPWPFHQESVRREVIEFTRQAFRLRDGEWPRLTANEQDRLVRALAAAEKNGGWSWWHYGREVYFLYRKYESWLLPEPRTGPVTQLKHLGDLATLLPSEPFRRTLEPHAGKWPEFALAVRNQLVSMGLAEQYSARLGPSRLVELPDPLRAAVETKLLPQLTPRELQRLGQSEGRWPEYCRELILLARQHDVALPGVMLPGSPKQWELWYSPRWPWPPVRSWPRGGS